jgi:hypothetical protein
MAWRNVGSFYLAAGATGRYKVWWGAPGDKGPHSGSWRMQPRVRTPPSWL